MINNWKLFILDIVLSTAHKAKGLEFSTVKLTDDYIGGAHLRIDYGGVENLNLIPLMFSEYSCSLWSLSNSSYFACQHFLHQKVESGQTDEIQILKNLNK